MLKLNKIYQGDCRELFKSLDDNSVDLIVTSPPYNVGIAYDSWNDSMEWEEYEKFTKEWLSESHRVLKPDGRIAINIPYEIQFVKNCGRRLISGEYYNWMVQSNLKYNGFIHLNEESSQRVKLTAWGSWLLPSAPYIYNASECILLGYKDSWKKESKGISYFDETQEKKNEFIKLCSGEWNYSAETRGKTKANFSVSLPENAIKILTWENDIVLDPFMGSGTTAIACKKLKRHYIGFEISDEYTKIANERIKNLVEEVEIF